VGVLWLPGCRRRVDDEELFRGGLAMLLGLEDDIEVVGKAGDGVAATELAAFTAPDVVLMDVRMPKGSGIEACVTLKEIAPSARIIMLTVSDEEADLAADPEVGGATAPLGCLTRRLVAGLPLFRLQRGQAPSHRWPAGRPTGSRRDSLRR
jgi:CheY-like chemotaxis protein